MNKFVRHSERSEETPTRLEKDSSFQSE